MEDRATEVRSEVRERVAPLGAESVFAQGFVLRPNLDALLHVGGEPQAARPSECVAGESFHPVDGLLGTPPELAGLVCAVRLARDVVPRGRASEREAAVAAARALADAARVVDAHTLALGRQRGRAGAARDAGADDRNIELVEFPRGDGGPRLGKPERLGLHGAMLRDAGAHPEVDASTGRY